MNSRLYAGFTIIETMLVLAITGLLVAGIFAGVGQNIATQRYRDAVETFKVVLQNQYAELGNVRNDRTDTWDCQADATIVENGTTVRGQSECLVLGRLVQINQGDINLYSVVGRPLATVTPGLDDVESLRANYILNVSPPSLEETAMEWGTQIAWPTEGTGFVSPRTPREVSLLLVRSPDSGRIYTFAANGVSDTPSPSNLRDMLIVGETTPGQAQQVLCVDSNGFLINDSQSVVIQAQAFSASAVESRTNDLFQQLGETTRC